MVQKAAESLTPREGTATSVVGGSRDEPTAQALVRPFFMVVRHVLANELSEMCLSPSCAKSRPIRNGNDSARLEAAMVVDSAYL